MMTELLALQVDVANMLKIMVKMTIQIKKNQVDIKKMKGGKENEKGKKL